MLCVKFHTKNLQPLPPTREVLSHPKHKISDLHLSNLSVTLRECVMLSCRDMQPPPPRRDHLPNPKQHEKSVSLWSILKECIGKDLSRICLPVYFNEPLSVLQKTVEDLEYAELLNKVGLDTSVPVRSLLSCTHEFLFVVDTLTLTQRCWPAGRQQQFCPLHCRKGTQVAMCTVLNSQCKLVSCADHCISPNVFQARSTTLHT